MFFFLSKLLLWVIMPLNIVLAIFLFSYGINRRYRKRIQIAALCLLLVLSNKFIANICMHLWEPEPRFISEMSDYDVAVVLTGVTDYERLPFDRVHFNKGVDRIYHAIQMYKLRKVDRVFISGGMQTTALKRNESESLAEYCMISGVPKKHIIVENQAKNTHQNAFFSRQLLSDTSKIVLITSAFHMPRAAACFNKQNLSFDTFPTDYYGRPPRFKLDEILLPNHDAFRLWGILFKEWVGLLVYKTVGYI